MIYIFFLIIFFYPVFQTDCSGRGIQLLGFPKELLTNMLIKQNSDLLCFKDLCGQRESRLKDGVLTIGTWGDQLSPHIQILISEKGVQFKKPVIFTVCKNKALEDVYDAYSKSAYKEWVLNRVSLHLLKDEKLVLKTLKISLRLHDVIERCCREKRMYKESLVRTFDEYFECAPHAFIIAGVKKGSYFKQNLPEGGVPSFENRIFWGNIASSFFGRRATIQTFANLKRLTFLLSVIKGGLVFLIPFLSFDDYKKLENDFLYFKGFYKSLSVFVAQEEEKFSQETVATINEKLEKDIISNNFEITPCSQDIGDHLLCAVELLFLNKYKFDQYWTEDDEGAFQSFDINQKLIFFYFKGMFDIKNFNDDYNERKIRRYIFEAAVASISKYFQQYDLPSSDSFPEVISPLNSNSFLSKLLISCNGDLSLFCYYLSNPLDIHDKVVTLKLAHKDLSNETIIKNISYFVDWKARFFNHVYDKKRTINPEQWLVEKNIFENKISTLNDMLKEKDQEFDLLHKTFESKISTLNDISKEKDQALDLLHKTVEKLEIVRIQMQNNEDENKKKQAVNLEQWLVEKNNFENQISRLKDISKEKDQELHKTVEELEKVRRQMQHNEDENKKKYVEKSQADLNEMNRFKRRLVKIFVGVQLCFLLMYSAVFVLLHRVKFFAL
jgi:hypothetical protein